VGGADKCKAAPFGVEASLLLARVKVAGELVVDVIAQPIGALLRHFLVSLISSGMEKPDEKKEKPAIKKGRELAPHQGKGIHPAFLVQNPIATPLGPVGEFLRQPDALPMFPAVVLFGQRRTGKSYSLRELMYLCFRHFPFGIVLSDTA
jgi:hypothetical protein